MSNENNLIYLLSSGWGKHDKKQQISSSGVVFRFACVVASCSVLHVFYQDFLFSHHLTSETNNKALIQRTSQYFDMTHVIAALSYFPVTLSWNRNTHRSYSELLPSYSELKHDTHRSYSELLPSYSELKHDTHCSCSRRLPWAASYSTCNCFSELVSFSSELKALEGLIWGIKYKLGTNSISSNSQKFSWIS